MKQPYLMCLDVHSRFCEYGAATPGGRILDRGQVPTSLPDLRELVQSLRRPRRVVLEEGPMAGWIYRGLKSVADEIVVCDPRRNALVAKEGDKDDPIDVLKLIQLSRADCLRPVHHSDSESRTAFKQLVALYHDRVTHRVAESNRVIWFLRQDGIVVKESAIADPQTGSPCGRACRGSGRSSWVSDHCWRVTTRPARWRTVCEWRSFARVGRSTRSDDSPRCPAWPGSGPRRSTSTSTRRGVFGASRPCGSTSESASNIAAAARERHG